MTFVTLSVKVDQLAYFLKIDIITLTHDTLITDYNCGSSNNLVHMTQGLLKLWFRHTHLILAHDSTEAAPAF